MVVKSNGETTETKSYSGANVLEAFLKAILQEEEKIKTTEKIVPITMGQGDWEYLNKATHCHVCGNPPVVESFLFQCLFTTPIRKNTASRRAKGAILETNQLGPNINVNHSTKWINELKTMKMIVHTASSHCTAPTSKAPWGTTATWVENIAGRHILHVIWKSG